MTKLKHFRNWVNNRPKINVVFLKRRLWTKPNLISCVSSLSTFSEQNVYTVMSI